MNLVASLKSLLSCSVLLAAMRLPASDVSSNQTPETVLTLKLAKDAAFERNWDLLAAKSGIDAAEAQLIVAKEFPNPTLALSSVKIGSHESATVLGNSLWNRSYDSIAAVTQLIEIAGKRGDRQKAARAGVLGARARFFDLRRTLEQGVTKAYAAALLADENARILHQSVEYLNQEAQIARERFKAGDLSDSDMKQIEISAEQYQSQETAAEVAAVQAHVAVELLIGVEHPAGKWRAAESLDALLPATIVVAETNSGAGRPDVLAAESDLESSKAQLKLQKAIRVPDPTILVQVEHEPPGGGPAVDTVGIGVSFPLPLWNLNGGNIRAAKAGVEQFQRALEKARAQVAADITSAASAYDEAFGRWQRYENTTRPKSGRVRESIAFAYSKGGASLLDLLDAERTDNDVRLATAQAMSDTVGALADLTAARAGLSRDELNSGK